ncbi:Replication initiation factor [Xylophilus ampelinus]|nr:Replication initiation factor [Xylophilus ampelinus]
MSELHDSPPSAGAGVWRLRRDPAAPAASARAVTRVESSPRSATNGDVSKIDWLNATFDTPAMSVRGLLAFVDGLMAGTLSAKLDGGLFGFTERHRLTAQLADGARVEVGAIALGGESQKGRWLLQLNGRGCGLVNDWASLQQLLEDLGAEISRVDIAADFLKGEHTVDDALDLYHEGAFISRGRNPDLDTQGAWHAEGKKGRTVYIGKLKNGKTLCVYEKGKQLKDLDSDWTRYEVRLGNRDRVIPLDVLTNPDRYFVGAYPALAHILEAAAEEIPTIREETKTSLAHLTYHLERCYGKTIHQVLAVTGATAQDLIEEVRVIGIPKRVDPASGSAGVGWADLQAQKSRMRA